MGNSIEYIYLTHHISIYVKLVFYYTRILNVKQIL